MSFNTLAIVGVGLIGASIGLAARRRGLVRQIIGVGRQWDSLRLAQQRGAIDEGTLDLSAAVAEADLVVFCTPVDLIAAQVLQAGVVCRPGTLLTDAGSTKSAIVRAVEDRLPRGVEFVGSHPLAGSEKRGPEHADPNLFQDRLTVVTRTPKTDEDALERTSAFWQALGSRVREMDPEAHDEALALTSHLPHLLAAALAGILSPELHSLTATGFRDTTRVAAGDPALWTAIFSQNRSAILDALGRVQDRLMNFKTALMSQDWDTVTSLLAEAKEVRDALGN
jgi:prephenate dehydrogenase